MDGWLYLSRGWNGGSITSPRWPALPSMELSGDFRFRPDGSAAETIGGNGQFGLAFDDFGHRFIVSNRNPLMHAVVHPRAWRGRAELRHHDVVEDVSPSGYDARVHPLSEDQTASGFMPDLISQPHAGSFTSACGIHWYTGDALGESRRGSWFICEPAQNLVQRQAMQPRGATFRSASVSTNADFLDASDAWFRPVFATTGPDGALYLASMYRRIIDHPDYLPEEARKRLDFVGGRGMGRIWRIRAADRRLDFRAALKRVEPGDPRRRAALLDDPNPWVRETGRRLVVESLEEAASDVAREPWRRPLQAVFERSARPASRAVAVHLLERWFQPTPEHGWLGPALSDASPGVREQGVRLVADQLHRLSNSAPQWLPRLRTMAGDPDAGVRFQVALALGEDSTPGSVPALLEILQRDGADRWTRNAVFSSLPPDNGSFFDGLAEAARAGRVGVQACSDAGWVLGARPDPELACRFAVSLLEQADDAVPWRLEALSGLSQGLRSRGVGAAAGGFPLQALLSPEQGGGARERIGRAAAAAARVAADGAASSDRRLAAIAFLGELDSPTAGEALRSLLAADGMPELQRGAIRGLGRFASPESGAALADPARLTHLPPDLRELAISTLGSHPALVPSLLSVLESGSLPLWTLPAGTRNHLRNHKDPQIRARAEKLFAQASSDRRKVYDDYKTVLALKPDAGNGHQVFVRLCASCHQHTGEGARVGPDLTGVRNQPPEALLLHILVPEAEIYPGYQSYTVETRDGRSLTGLLASDQGGSVTLRQAQGLEETVQRSNIASMRLSALSLMPQGLEQSMTRQELADLVGFLKRGGY
jgi:putative heme-binding domain-containing protein